MQNGESKIAKCLLHSSRACKAACGLVLLHVPTKAGNADANEVLKGSTQCRYGKSEAARMRCFLVAVNKVAKALLRNVMLAQLAKLAGSAFIRQATRAARHMFAAPRTVLATRAQYRKRCNN